MGRPAFLRGKEKNLQTVTNHQHQPAITLKSPTVITRASELDLRALMKEAWSDKGKPFEAV